MTQVTLLDSTQELLNSRLQFLATDQAKTWAEAQASSDVGADDLLVTLQLHAETALVELESIRQHLSEYTDLSEYTGTDLPQDGSVEYANALHQQALSGNIALGITPEIEPSPEDELLLASIEGSVANALIIFNAAVSYEASDEGTAAREAIMQSEIQNVIAAFEANNPSLGFVVLSSDELFIDDDLFDGQNSSDIPVAITEGDLVDLNGEFGLGDAELSAAIELQIPVAPPATEVVALLTDLASNMRLSYSRGELSSADLQGIASSISAITDAQQLILAKAGVAVEN